MIKQAEVIVIERLGRFDRILTPGLHFVVPFLERPREILWTYIQEVERGRYYRYVRSVERYRFA